MIVFVHQRTRIRPIILTDVKIDEDESVANERGDKKLVMIRRRMIRVDEGHNLTFM